MYYKKSAKQLAIKKVCSLQDGCCENPRWQTRNGSDGRLISKILMTTIHENLVSNPRETWRRQHKMLVFNFVISLRLQPFIDLHAPSISHLFSQQPS